VSDVIWETDFCFPFLLLPKDSNVNYSWVCFTLGGWWGEAMNQFLLLY
jgi:hypothetical protein